MGFGNRNASKARLISNELLPRLGAFKLAHQSSCWKNHIEESKRPLTVTFRTESLRRRNKRFQEGYECHKGDKMYKPT